MQLVTDDEKVFDTFMAHYGKFENVKNYIIVAGKKGISNVDCGYYGEKVVIKAQQLGLNTCWVALTYGKKQVGGKIKDGERLCCVIAIGYGKTQGAFRKTKTFEQLTKTHGEIPHWFKKGVDAAMLAPTAMNQQKFVFELKDNTVRAKALRGFYTQLDLGIVKYHFEVGAGKENFKWA